MRARWGKYSRYGVAPTFPNSVSTPNRGRRNTGDQLYTNMEFFWLYPQRYGLSKLHQTRGTRHGGRSSYSVVLGQARLPNREIEQIFQKRKFRRFYFGHFPFLGGGAPLLEKCAPGPPELAYQKTRRSDEKCGRQRRKSKATPTPSMFEIRQRECRNNKTTKFHFSISCSFRDMAPNFFCAGLRRIISRTKLFRQHCL